jgi:hypothetical protein
VHRRSEIFVVQQMTHAGTKKSVSVAWNWNVNAAAELSPEYALSRLLTFEQTGSQRDNRRNVKMKMKKILMTTVAAAALVGFTAMATAQTMQAPSGGAAKPEIGQTEQKGNAGGALKYQGEQPAEKAQSTDKTAPSTANTAQGTPQGSPNAAQPNAAKPDQKMGQSQKPEANPQRGAADERGKTGNTGANTAASKSNSGGAKADGASVALSRDQRSKIGATIRKHPSARVTADVNFNISVGATVPRSVHVVAVPEDVVEIVPQYEGYDYIVVGEQVLIVDPNTMEIVAVIEA